MAPLYEVRWHLFPEIRVSQGTFDLGSPSAPKVETVPDIVRVMDLQQEQLSRSMGEGHRVIHGVAGSGKTMILGYRAQVLAQAIASKPILSLRFNCALFDGNLPTRHFTDARYGAPG